MEEHIKHTRLPFSCGAGEASVNVRTGRYIFIHPDFEVGDGDYPISVAHVFNPEIPFADVTPCMGHGWKLNVQQYVIPNAGTGRCDSDRFTYIDEKGYSHRFEKYHNASQYYYAADVNLTLQVTDWKCRDDEGTRYVIIDDAGNQKNFDPLGRLRSVVSARNPNAEQVFEYDGDKLTVIYAARKPSEKISLVYEENRLSKITYEESESSESGGEVVHVIRTLCYGYDEKGNLSGIIRRTWNSEKKTETIETVACFTYDLEKDIGALAYPLYHLTKAVDGKENSALQLDYMANTVEGVYRVQKVTVGFCPVMAEGDGDDPYGYGYGDNGEIAAGVEGCPVFAVGAMSRLSVKAWAEFTPGYEEEDLNDGYYIVTVEDDKGGIMDYCFDENGLTNGTSER
ncbi:MAG: hypothetical protein FWD58_03095 [Firmicutes bacterium]|nr:hypothetical protein [Bacillota bacterium]